MNKPKYEGIVAWDDNQIVPWGKHSGKHLYQLPDDYLCYFWKTYAEQYLAGSMNWKDGIAFIKYIEENLDSLKC